MKSAHAYIRVSGGSQADRDGPQRQRTAIQRFAADRGIELIGEFSDVVSGTVAHRQQFREMLLHKEADCIIVETIDRIARDVFVLILLLRRLRNNGFGCMEVTTGQDLVDQFHGTPEQRCLVMLRGVMAETDKRQIVRRLRTARERKRANGERCEGRKPFGQHEGESVTLELMKEMRMNRKLHYATIANELNRFGYSTRTGRPWTDVHVGQILRRQKK